MWTKATIVKKGQVIARIDRDQVESQRNRDEASLQQLAIAIRPDGDFGPMAAPDARERCRAAHRRASRVTGSPGRNWWPDPARRKSRKPAPPWPTPRRSTIKRRPIGIARRIFSRTTTFPNSSTINTACDWTAPPPLLRQSDERLGAGGGRPAQRRYRCRPRRCGRAPRPPLQASRSQSVGVEAPRTGCSRAPRRSGASPRANGHHQHADQRHRGYRAHRRRGSGEIGRSGRSAGRRHHRRHHRRHRSSLAARLHQRDRPGPRKVRPAGVSSPPTRFPAKPIRAASPSSPPRPNSRPSRSRPTRSA